MHVHVHVHVREVINYLYLSIYRHLEAVTVQKALCDTTVEHKTIEASKTRDALLGERPDGVEQLEVEGHGEDPMTLRRPDGARRCLASLG